MTSFSGGKPGLTKLLEELTILLPKALECCPAETGSQSSNLIIKKLKNVLLDLLNGCVTCTIGKHVLAVVRILKVVVDKLPATFTSGAQHQAVAYLLQLLSRLPEQLGTLDEPLLAVWCSIAGMLAEQDPQLLLELHAGTVDLLLDLEQLLFELAVPNTAAAPAGRQLCLYQGLLLEAQHAAQQQQQQQLLLPEPFHDAGQQQPQQRPAPGVIQVAVEDEQVWQAYTALGLRLLLYLLEEFPAQLGSLTPTALVPALGQILSYSSSELQELCLNAMTLMVVQHNNQASVVGTTLQHVLWLLECAAGGHIPAAVCTASWQVAAAACVAACTSALDGLGMLGMYAEKLMQCLCSATNTTPLSKQRCLWLRLLLEVLTLSPSHAGTPALQLPLTVASSAAGQDAVPDTAADVAAAEAALLQVWQDIGGWTAHPDIRGIIDRQILLLHPSLQLAGGNAVESTGDVVTSPVKKKRRKLKQAQLTAEGGFLSSQRPGKGSSSQPSDTGEADKGSGASISQPSVAELAVQTMQQLLQLQPAATDAAAVARITGVMACLGPSARVPANVAKALGLQSLVPAHGEADSGTAPQLLLLAAEPGEQDHQEADLHKVHLLLVMLQGLASAPHQSPALLACLSQQVVAWLPQASRQPELCARLLPSLLLAMVATACSAAAEPSATELHMAVWHHARDWLQGASSMYNSGAAGPPSPLLAATSIAWLTLSRLLGWGGTAAVSAASAQIHAGCTSVDPACAAAAVLLLPIQAFLQHAQFSEAQQQACAGGAAPGIRREQQQHGSSQQLSQQSGHLLQVAGGCHQVLSSFMQALQELTAGNSTAVVQLSAIHSVSWLLQSACGGVQAEAVAAWLQDAAQAVLRIHSSIRQSTGSAEHKQQATEAALPELLSKLGPYCPPMLAASSTTAAVRTAGSSSGVALQLPPLMELLPVMQPAFLSSSSSSSGSAAPQVQVAALQLLSSYLQAVEQPELLAGSKQLLLDALGLIKCPVNAVRDAALELAQQHMRAPVLKGMFGHLQQQPGNTELPHAGNDAANLPSLAMQLLQHIKMLLDGSASGQQQQQQEQGRQQESVGMQLALLRVVAGLYDGMISVGDCAELPLLYLLGQVMCEHAQVSATALELLQHLALRHTGSKELEELLIQGPAGPSLLSAVGRALATQPHLFTQLAGLVQVPESQLAASVAVDLVPWLCQQRLKEPLELLASKLGVDAGRQLVLRASGMVLAEQLWHNPEGLGSFMEWVDDIMKPHTFSDVLKTMGRYMTRCIIDTAGSAELWGGLYQPPPALLARAHEYVGFVAKGMDMDGPAGFIELLQGETIALLLKHIGNTLSKDLHPQGGQDNSGLPGRLGSAQLGCEALQQIVDPILQQQGGALGAGQSHRLGSASGSVCVSIAEKMQCLRALYVLMHLLQEHLGTHAFQMMAVLSESLMYCTEGSLRMQALSAWLGFVQLLAAHAPAVLKRVAAQAAVVLLPVLELASQEGSAVLEAAHALAANEAGAGAAGMQAAGEVDAAAVKLAAEVLHEIVVRQRMHVCDALRNMPPLPSLDVLKEVNAVLAQEQHRQGPLQQLQLLISALQHKSIAVRHVGMGEVRSFLLHHRSFMSDTMSGLLSCSGPAALPHDKGSSGGAAAGTAPKASKAGKNGDGSVKLPPGRCRELTSELLAALLASCENLPRMGQNLSQARLVQSMKHRCAQCLGLLGAIDPAHVRPELPRPAPFAYKAEDCLKVLVQQHLVRVLQTACDIAQLEVTSYAIQQLLQTYSSRRLQKAAQAMKTFSVAGFEAAMELDEERMRKKKKELPSPADPGGLFSLLDDDVQSIVKPFLTTKFCVSKGQAKPSDAADVLFGSQLHSFRRWLFLWVKQLSRCTCAPLAAAFEACRGMTSWDTPLMVFLLPFMMVEVAGQSEEGLQMIIREMAAVMEYAVNPEGHIADIELYVQCIFTQLDLLQNWVQEQQQLYEKAAERAAQAAGQAATAAGNGRQNAPAAIEVQLPPFVTNVQSLITAIPIETRAHAALRCGSYARALQYFETYVRDKHGGGLNPSAYNGGCTSYDYDDVSFLLEVYGQLEEPDGLAGLVQLRQGGLTTSDQILVAEKAGAWSEALALYELALSQEAAAAARHAAQAQTGAAGAAGTAAPGGTGPAGAAADVLMQAARAVAAGTSGDGLAAYANQQQLLLVGEAGVVGAAGVAARGAASYHGVSTLQIGHLRCLLQMGHHQTLLHQVDGLIGRCLGSNSASLGSDPAALNPDTASLATLNPGGPSATELQGMAAGGAQWWVTQLAALGLAAAWRLGAWGVLRGYLAIIEAAAAANVRLPPNDCWEVCVGTILEAAQRGAYSEVLAGLASERAGVLGLLPAIAGESYTRAYPDLLKLHMLQELEDACMLMQRPQPVGPVVRGRMLRWQERLQLTAPLLSCREPLLALRRQLAGLLNDADAMGRCWLQHAKLCRSTGHQEAAETSVLEAQARGVPGALLERCRLLWDRDKGHRAIMELQLVVQQSLDADDKPDDATLQHQRAKEMLQLTEWMAAVGQGHKDMLCANFEDAIQLDGHWEKAHFSYAVYLDDLYRDAKQREGKPATAAKGMDRLGGRSRVRTQEDSPLDYLPQALEHYGESIRVGHKHVLQSLPRLLTLYFAFGSKMAAAKTTTQKMRNAHTQVSGVMRGLIRNIPTYKWLLVLPQLTSRIYHPQQDVQEFMQTLLGAIVDHFPQQALWAMAMVTKSTVRQRQEAASVILSQAKRRSGESGRALFDSFSRLMDQLIKACMWQPPSDKRMSRCSAHKEFKHLCALLPLDVQVPVQALFTVDLPPGGKLPPGHRPVNSQTCLAGIKDEVQVMASLMKPKKITFVGSDGREYPFLAKPKDDLRKDYRLMDFAGTLNALLARQPQARRRGLSLRTYAVLPLTDDCGILQWVNNLVPFKSACEEILVKEKLYVKHQTPMQIKKMYDSFAGGNRAQLLDRVLSSLPPSLGKWLLARFAEPGAWLAARLAFTRTNAAWAMVGHVLGLGDRHGDNIMIHGLTGETVHVDFGCLFDKGLTLEVPEMVPFRLTQNVVDAFGVSGVEGAYRRAAEMTLQVLRDNKATLMTGAETFLHDPLVDWARGFARPAGGSSTAAGLEADNVMAKDALHVMEGRLSGTLLGVAAIPSLPLSCEGQAARLIEEASDHENLGKMYIWWMPWL